MLKRSLGLYLLKLKNTLFNYINKQTTTNKMCEVVSHKPLRINDIKKNKDLMEFLLLEEDYSKSTIKSENYKQIILSINGKNYLMYHGFPNDVVACIFIGGKYIVDLMNDEINETIPEKYIDDIKEIRKWYNRITEKCTTFTDNFFY
jgi:hypothetical protein